MLYYTRLYYTLLYSSSIQYGVIRTFLSAGIFLDVGVTGHYQVFMCQILLIFPNIYIVLKTN